MRVITILTICAAVLACSSFAFAADYWVVRGVGGQFMVVDSRPTDPGVIVQGPFASRSAAERVAVAGVFVPGAAPGPAPTSEAERTAPARYWVVRGDLGSFRIVNSQPTDPGVIVQGPFASKEEAYNVIYVGGPYPAAPATAGPGSMPMGIAATQYWVVRGTLGKLMVVDSQPTDPGVIYQGPFATRAEAYNAARITGAYP